MTIRPTLYVPFSFFSIGANGKWSALKKHFYTLLVLKAPYTAFHSSIHTLTHRPMADESNHQPHDLWTTTLSPDLQPAMSNRPKNIKKGYNKS